MYRSFKDMPVWQPMDAAEKIFSATDHLPKKEDYGLTSQIRRAALSVPANIAEAYERSHTLDKVNFYYNARGSLTETQNHLEYAKRVGYISVEDAVNLDSSLTSLHHEINKIITTLKAAKA